jgi:hypothetical protein
MSICLSVYVFTVGVLDLNVQYFVTSTTIWRSEIHTSLKLDADTLSRRRRRLLLRCKVHHISQGE